jgi:pimeloyl-ACP methyl ester carboxylesterase
VARTPAAVEGECSTPSANVNGTSIYYERVGSGPPLLFIHGALGDASRFTSMSERFAGEYTVVTYDRRGHSRSPRGNDWKPISLGEQADDAAGLLRALSLAPAHVYGSSGGAIVALNLVIRHPAVVQCAILHEPPLVPVLEHPELVQADMGAAIEKGMQAGGPPAAAESFLRWVAGDASFEALTPEQRERTRGNAGTFLEEFTVPTPLPDDATLAAIAVPVRVMASEGSMPWFAEAAGWLAKRLGVDVVRTPGSHTPQRDHPGELEANVRSLLNT